MESNGTLRPQVDPEVWAKRYGIEVKSIECSKCKKPQLVNIPIAFGEYRGFEAALHECGAQYRSYSVTPINPKTKAFFVSAFKALAGDPDEDKT